MPITDSQETSNDGLISQIRDSATHSYSGLSRSSFEETLEGIQRQLVEQRSQRSHDYGSYYDYLYYSPRRSGRSYGSSFEEYYRTYWNAIVDSYKERKVERPMTERERYFKCIETKTKWIPKQIINEEE